MARRLRIKELDSPIFSVSSFKSGPSNGSRIAPGMEICYVVKFKPELIQDYACELVCTTDREKFVVPIQALGPRGILDFPDEISFEESAVKHVKTKSIFVRNIGNAPARYRIEAPEPFSIEPRQSIIPSQESIQMIVSFNPQVRGAISFRDKTQNVLEN